MQFYVCDEGCGGGVCVCKRERECSRKEAPPPGISEGAIRGFISTVDKLILNPGTLLSCHRH